MDLQSDQIDYSVPAVQAIGVPDSINKDGDFDEYDVQISVTFSPKKGAVATAGSTVTRMTRTKFAAFREETNAWTGRKFLEEYFPDALAKAKLNNPVEKARPVFVINNQTGEVSDGQHVTDNTVTAASSVATTVPPKQPQSQPDVTSTTEVKNAAYDAPVTGGDTASAPVLETPEYQSNDSNEFKTTDEIAADKVASKSKK